MPTKAQEFRRRAERTKPPKKKKPARPRRDVPVDTAKKGVSATDRKVGKGNTALRNKSAKAKKRGGAALETSATTPSRKSTRKSTGRAKRTSNLKRRQTRKVTSPKARAARATAKKR